MKKITKYVASDGVIYSANGKQKQTKYIINIEIIEEVKNGN